MSIQNLLVEELPFLYAYGCIGSNNATTPNTKLDISLGQVRDSNDNVDISIASSLTVDFSVNGLNGLDTGSIGASKVYAFYAVADSANKNPSGFIATLATNSSPLMPYGYDSSRLVLYWSSDASSHLLKGYMYGNSNSKRFVYDAVQATAITAGNATSYTAVDLTGLVPPLNNIAVNIKSATTPSAAGRGVFLQPVNATGDAIVILGQVTSVVINSYNDVLAQLTSSLAKINYKVSNGSDAVALSVAGFGYSI